MNGLINGEVCEFDIDPSELEDNPQNDMIPVEYGETTTIIPRPAYEQYTHGCRLNIVGEQRFKEEVEIRPGIRQKYYNTTSFIYPESTRRRYITSIQFIPGLQPKHYTSTVYAFPKWAQKTYLSSVKHHDAQTIKWYKCSVQMETRDFISVKLIHVS
ncbi:refilin-A-like isoform X2 [Anneissia japonica]|uniref:refilin-A-like isoform X2 n=1 Tax=Anneissia japonica TaxID=1529436 RepID=UPI001425791D|nr:refilin-A-like isoform X2 [Anneissia japonica]